MWQSVRTFLPLCSPWELASTRLHLINAEYSYSAQPSSLGPHRAWQRAVACSYLLLPQWGQHTGIKRQDIWQSPRNEMIRNNQAKYGHFFHKADLQMKFAAIESDASLQSWLLFLEETRQGQEKRSPHFCGAQLPPRAHQILASAAGSGKCQLSLCRCRGALRPMPDRGCSSAPAHQLLLTAQSRLKLFLDKSPLPAPNWVKDS